MVKVMGSEYETTNGERTWEFGVLPPLLGHVS